MNCRRWVSLLLCVFFLGGPLLAASRLSIDNPFAVLGTSVTFSVEGEAGSNFILLQAQQPNEIRLGPLGTLFLAQDTLTLVGAGRIGVGGSASLSFPIPSAGIPDGSILYTQALVLSPAGPELSNAVPLRAQSQPAAGPRAPRSIASSPDGSKAYVAHQLDGAVSVIDAVNDVKITELPVGPSARAIPHRPLEVAIDPEGRHAFVVNTASHFLTVIHVASDSIAAQLEVPAGCRRVAFDFSGSRKIYLTNETENSILVFEENPPGQFSQLDSLPLEGDNPGPIALLPDGNLMVGHRSTLDLEVVDPGLPPGEGTLTRISLESQPYDITVAGSEALVPTFITSPIAGVDGFNRVLRIDLANFQVAGFLYHNQGTDYRHIAIASPFIVVTAAGSGTVLVADAATRALLEVVDLAPAPGFAPTATPQQSTLIRTAGGDPAKLYVVNYFRETVRPVLLGAGPPFGLGQEIALAYSGQPRIPLSGDLAAEEDGDWFFRSVQFYNGTPTTPNPVTCATCHPDGASDNITHARQPQALWGTGETGPYLWRGTQHDLLSAIQGTFQAHGKLGGNLVPGSDLLILDFLNFFQPPRSIFLEADGTLRPEAEAGKSLFEGQAQCTSCHAPTLFIPQPPDPLTIPEGVGTSLIPANVPSLRGAWATAPYLADGSAQTLLEVLRGNPADVHGLLTEGLTAQELDQLVAYLKSL